MQEILKRYNLDELKQISEYLTLKNKLKGPAIGSIIFGIIAILGALVTLNLITPVLLLIGFFLLVEGIWVLVSPQPKGFILEAIVFALVGIFNIGISILEILISGDGASIIWIIVGIVQIGFAINILKLYNRFKEMPIDKPSKETMKDIDSLIKNIKKAKPKDNNNIIQFELGNIMKMQWKALLMKEYGIFIDIKDEILILDKKEVIFEDKGKVLIGKTRNLQIELGEMQLKGNISPENMERLGLWKENKLYSDG